VNVPAIALAAALLLAPWDTAAAGNRGERVDDFIARIARIKTTVGDLTWTGGLLRVPEFRQVHAHPREHRDAALAALESATLGEEEKVIVALSMQKLPLPELVRFGERVLDLLEADRVPETVFNHAVFPTYDWNTALVEGFADPAVQRLLQRVVASPRVNDGRKHIVKDEILTGNAQRDVVEMREAGEIR
jgi:hypothetical protein